MWKGCLWGICGQQRPRSASASGQTDLDLRCVLAESLDIVVHVYVEDSNVSYAFIAYISLEAGLYHEHSR